MSLVRYMLGDGRRSFVVGHGRHPPLRPHHRGASCPQPPAPCNHSALHSPKPNPNRLTGALVGGPFFDDSYPDDRSDHIRSEVSLSDGSSQALCAASRPVSWRCDDPEAFSVWGAAQPVDDINPCRCFQRGITCTQNGKWLTPAWWAAL